MPDTPQPVVWRTAPIVPSTVASYPVAVNKLHTEDPPTVLFTFPLGYFIDYWLMSKDIAIV